MLSHDITTIPGEVSVEIVPQIFLSEIGAYDQNDENPNHFYFVVSDIDALEQEKIDLSFSNKPTHFRRISSYHRRSIDEAFHFPLIVSKDTGLPFLLACNFLYEWYKLTSPSQEVPTTTTVRVYAHHLAHMFNFFYTHRDEFDYLNFKFRLENQRPVSKYWNFLREQMDEGNMSRENARLHQSTSAHFFKYARRIGLIDPKAELWREETINVQISSATRGKANKQIVRPVHAIKRIRNKSVTSSYIFDGEPLRPLNANEQKIFVSALKKISPTWFKYLAITCLLTGARLGSIGTLREKHVIDLKRQMALGTAIPFVKAGTAHTLIQTKHDKPLNLYFPRCAVNYIDAYLSSNVRKKDLKKAESKGFVFEDKHNQHLFINQQGCHIYWSKFNINLLKDWIPPSTRPGSVVSHFVSEILKPEMQKLGYQGNFTFHFLRATFAMNFIKANYRLNMSNEEINKLLDNLKDLLGHSDIKVTQRYLNHYNTDLSDSPISLANEEFVNELLNGL
ncbi:tyrosine-type recombinase/integrase [Methylobacter sp. BlB1]|uniref:tyrosine-type recombinase/integrase n=1 Tax=Methylobacter sp. BlB1 TaxID=2785914 RepID=UPI001893C3D3|nr:tyrosine-type recombinase/integrase [Methylobacter sp. BlB1]MBF6650715.1 tyrosine-type recombinase/integrase [Methylobacter sp. BlB1]